jgi:hypothetical protein
MVAFTSLEPVRAFAAIMVLAPLLLMLMLAISITTENPKTQPERGCRLVVLGCSTIGCKTVGRIAWGTGNLRIHVKSCHKGILKGSGLGKSGAGISSMSRPYFPKRRMFLRM